MNSAAAGINAECLCSDAFEREAWQSGVRRVAGVDEVGRGALAGPVVAAAVILNPDHIPDGLNDSKKLTRPERERLDVEIRASAQAYAIARVEADEIDHINILEATKKAMERAIACLTPSPDYLLIDALMLKGIEIPQRAIIRGDAQSVSIAAASIIAKVARDAWMRSYEESLPGYGFANNVGYGTPDHMRGLRTLGPSQIHRLTFHGVLLERSLFE
ncbi:MAG TPA: ribonuclease HII [Blastocatellia bacterium]|nr:ribonuclease HII [Blastocatellia bacterium]